MADYARFQTGGAVYPLTSATTNSLLQDADPSLFYVLDYYSYCLTNYFGARLLAEAAKVPVIAPIAAAVQYILPLDPVTFLQESQVQFPLLAIYRVKETYKWKSIGWNEDVSQWKVSYVLPPITAGQRERIQPILRAAAKVLQNRTENMFDPGYTPPGFALGSSPWAAANLEEINLISGEYEFWSNTGNLSFPTWTGTLEVKERDLENATQFANSFGGLDAEIDLAASPNQPVVTDLADVTVTYAAPLAIPTLLSLHRADAGITAGVDPSRVGGWADQTGRGVSLSPGGPANQPSLVPQATPNGKPTLRFDGSLSYLTGTNTSLANDTGKTYVVLFRLSDTVSRSSILLHSGGSANTTISLEANTASSAGGLLGFFANGSSFDAATAADLGWHVAVIRVANTTAGGTVSTSTTYQIDSIANPLTLKSGAGTWLTMSASNQLIVGGLPSSLSTTAAHVDIGVVMTFSSALSDANAALAVLYCRQWAGLSLT